MKKLIIPLLLSGLILTTGGVKSASAQIRLKEVTVTGASSSMEISKKVSDSFSRLFKDVLAPQWLEVNKRFIVNFIQNDQKNKAVFTKVGTLVYHLIYGNEEQMPKSVRDLVKSRYYDYAITSAINVKAQENDVWIVNVEDATQIMVLRIEDGAMTVIQKITKA
ncbi:MAG TPA: hypothetical protein VEV16_02775 [Daejeonella sp.]|nr:hypothetical protein [Daejeonella sp.]